MKNITKMRMTALLFFIGLLLSCQVFGDAPPPPPEGGHGSGGNQVPGGGAPIGSGIVVLITLAAGYGAKRVFNEINSEKEEI